LLSFWHSALILLSVAHLALILPSLCSHCAAPSALCLRSFCSHSALILLSFCSHSFLSFSVLRSLCTTWSWHHSTARDQQPCVSCPFSLSSQTLLQTKMRFLFAPHLPSRCAGSHSALNLLSLLSFRSHSALILLSFYSHSALIPLSFCSQFCGHLLSFCSHSAHSPLFRTHALILSFCLLSLLLFRSHSSLSPFVLILFSIPLTFALLLLSFCSHSTQIFVT